MSDDEERLIDRLRALGARPLEPEVAHRALARARGVRPGRRTGVRIKIGAAAVAGFAVGSLGLATAGALPGPAQDAAHAVLDSVGVGVPPGHQPYDPASCGGSYKNHGAYVRAHKADPNAGQSPCGRPAGSVNHPDDATGDTSGAAGSGHHGPPPWAHGHGKGNPSPGTSAGGKGAPDDQGGDQGDQEAPEPTEPAGAAPTTAAPAHASPTTPPPTTPTTATPTTSTSTTSTSTTSTSTTSTTRP